jgi:hypothetical protein
MLGMKHVNLFVMCQPIRGYGLVSYSGRSLTVAHYCSAPRGRGS